MEALREAGCKPGEFSIFVDGGIRRGADIFKAVALGATGVGAGRPVLYALASYGQGLGGVVVVTCCCYCYLLLLLLWLLVVTCCYCGYLLLLVVTVVACCYLLLLLLLLLLSILRISESER
ncbi:unnamed protein product [Polarella glacialis]|uniref:FMN-dependent dehydrogenase domain-containing protein n=1 Tax=Polarella glacialis TaxID=89957 RepID=A0A813HYK4_POLGL|nr:unnamed protein product [Polarella glacialis]